MHTLRILSERDTASTDSKFCVFLQNYLLEKFLIHVEKILFVKIKTFFIFVRKTNLLK